MHYRAIYSIHMYVCISYKYVHKNYVRIYCTYIAMYIFIYWIMYIVASVLCSVFHRYQISAGKYENLVQYIVIFYFTILNPE